VKRWYTDGKPTQEERLRAAAADESLTFERYLGLMTSVLRPVDEGEQAASVEAFSPASSAPSATEPATTGSTGDAGGVGAGSAGDVQQQWAEEELLHVEPEVERAYRKEFEAMDVDGDGTVTVNELLTHLSDSPEQPSKKAAWPKGNTKEVSSGAGVVAQAAVDDCAVDDNDISLRLEDSAAFPRM
jgi:hypothetical protein